MKSLEDIHFPGFYFQLAQNFASKQHQVEQRFNELGISPTILTQPQATLNGVQAKQLLTLARTIADENQLLSVALLEQIDFPAVLTLLLSISKPETLRDLHELVARTCHVLIPNGMLITDCQDHGFTYSVDPLGDFGEETNTLVELILGFFYFLQKCISPKSVKEIHLYLTNTTQHHDLYKRSFECHLHLNSERNTIVFPQVVVDIPFPNIAALNLPQPSVNLSLANLSLPMIAFKATPFYHQVKQVIRDEALQGRFLDRHDIAEVLAVSIRSLSRKLHQEGKNFKALQLEVKIELAKSFLADPSIRLSSVASKSGFEAQPSFNRAFKKCVGVTPKTYRENALKIAQVN